MATRAAYPTGPEEETQPVQLKKAAPEIERGAQAAVMPPKMAEEGARPTEILHAAGGSVRDEFRVAPMSEELGLSVVVFGASGDLAHKFTFPALYAMFCKK